MIAFEVGWFRALMNQVGLPTVESLSAESGVSRPAVTRAYHGQQVRVTTALKLLATLQERHNRQVRADELRRKRAYKAEQRALKVLNGDFTWNFNLDDVATAGR
jgi:hypothetical protein